MTDINHIFGGDIGDFSGGDVFRAEGDTEDQQAIIRRLATNPGDYMWDPDYGAGLRRFIGGTSLAEAESVCVSQILLEDTVARHPAPVVKLRMDREVLLCTITYTKASSNELKSFSFSIEE